MGTQEITCTKAVAFAADAKNAGWEAELAADSEEQDVTWVIATRYTEEVRISWKGEACRNGSSHTRDGYTRMLRNAAACRRVLTDGLDGPVSSGGMATKRVVRIAPTRDWDAEANPVRPPAKRLPFRISQPDRDIIEAVLGKKITWWNEKARRVETSWVLPRRDQRHLGIIHAKGKRILNWAGVAAEATGNQMSPDGFRSVYIDSILEVA